jgi:hypothetical protein
MDEPNLQTVPKPVTFFVDASQLGEEATPEAAAQPITCNIRAAFVAPPGWVMLGADYCQLELRLMAHFSGDAGLRAMLAQPGGDPFRLLAARWLGVAKPEQVGAGWLWPAGSCAAGVVWASPVLPLGGSAPSHSLHHDRFPPLRRPAAARR